MHDEKLASASAPHPLEHPLLQHLDTCVAREDMSPPELFESPDQPAQVSFATTHERSTITLAMLLLRELQHHKLTSIPDHVLDKVFHRLWKTIDPYDRVDIEIEAFEIIDSLAKAIAPTLSAKTQATPKSVSPESSHAEVAQWAIYHGKDLKLELYDSDAGKLVSHLITPMSLDAAMYLRALSHTTKEVCIFSLKHIGTLEPATGWTMSHRQGPQQPPSHMWNQLDEERQQMSWLDELPAPLEEE